MNTTGKLGKEHSDNLIPFNSDYDENVVRDFIAENLSYVNVHGYDDEDLEKAMAWRAAINARYKETKGTPQAGDIVHIYANKGVEYARARITECSCSTMSICTQPHVPWVNGLDSKNIRTNTDGGYFQELEPEKLELLGKVTAEFTVWGRLGAGGGQAINFCATVNHWKLEDKAFY